MVQPLQVFHLLKRVSPKARRQAELLTDSHSWAHRAFDSQGLPRQWSLSKSVTTSLHQDLANCVKPCQCISGEGQTSERAILDHSGQVVLART